MVIGLQPKINKSVAEKKKKHFKTKATNGTLTHTNDEFYTATNTIHMFD